MEIERKFLMDGCPDALPLLKIYDVVQAYLCTKPEVRVRAAKVYFAATPEDDSWTITVKGPGSLSREEIEYNISEEDYNRILGMIPEPYIIKDHREFLLPCGRTLHYSVVDPGTEHEWQYAEIEFEDEESAKAFKPYQFLGKEVTEDEFCKMKSYWERRHKSVVEKEEQ